MKPRSRHLPLCLAFAGFCAFALGAIAQDAPKAEEKSAPPAATATPPASGATPAANAEKSELRRIDDPAAPAAPAENADADTPTGRRGRQITNTRFSGSGERIAIGHDSLLAKGEQADTVVAIFGSATNEGDVGDSVVSVLGNTRVTGHVGDTAVSVLGSTYVNSKVGGEVVAVLGDVELGPDAEVNGDVVAVGGKVTRDPKAIVHGDVHNVGVGPAFGGHSLDGLVTWFRDCLRYGRLLWIGPKLAWAWAVALCFLAFYLLLAALFRGGIERCVTTFETRPGSSIVASLLTILLSPVLIVLLCVTVVGIALVPFLAVALLVATLFGKAVMLAWLGRRITRFFGDGPLNHPVFAVLVGGVIVTMLYMVPIVGLITYKLLKVLGLGVVVYTLLQSSKREKPAGGSAAPMPVPVAPVSASAGAASVAAAGAAPMMSVGFGAPSGVVAGDPVGAPAIPVPLAPPVHVPATTLPRAGFWIRTGALLIDLILLGFVVMSLLQALPHGTLPNGSHYDFRPSGPQPMLIAIAVYAAIMWKMKGTTIGGVVCGLKVIRVDGRPIDWATSWVRAFSCFLSLIVAGLGFVWVVIDDDKQSWHDKIAGTTVVRTPKGTPLV